MKTIKMLKEKNKGRGRGRGRGKGKGKKREGKITKKQLLVFPLKITNSFFFSHFRKKYMRRFQ